MKRTPLWDVIIIGGGATGLGIAVDAASRGYRTLLLEQSDFAKGTSSRSTKLVHGGIRYLAQGNIRLVFSALRERGILLRNAPHLVKKQSFLIPCYTTWEKLTYYFGLKLYDWLAGYLSFGSSKYLSKQTLHRRMPGLETKNLKGGVEYFDGQFDDARLAINLAQTAVGQNAAVINYFKVTALSQKDGKLCGVLAVDLEDSKTYCLKAKTVVNATGIFVDDVLRMEQQGNKPLIKWSQGVHIVVDKSFLNSNSALLVPQTADGRVLFAVPWYKYVLIGTTDTPMDKHSLEPVALKEEVQFILDTVKHYLARPPQAKDILTVFAGLRPLVMPNTNSQTTKEISRDHKIFISKSGLITITGGKWTTYRKMAEDVVNTIIRHNNFYPVSCKTKKIKIHGYDERTENNPLSLYGSDADYINELARNGWNKRLVDSLPYIEAEVVWCIRNEMARTVEDVLARRLRILFLDANAATKAAPRVADILQHELGKNNEWKKVQLQEFQNLAQQYLP